MFAKPEVSRKRACGKLLPRMYGPPHDCKGKLRGENCPPGARQERGSHCYGFSLRRCLVEASAVDDSALRVATRTLPSAHGPRRNRTIEQAQALWPRLIITDFLHPRRV